MEMIWKSLTSFLVSFDAILYEERICTLTFQEMHHPSYTQYNKLLQKKNLSTTVKVQGDT